MCCGSCWVCLYHANPEPKLSTWCWSLCCWCSLIPILVKKGIIRPCNQQPQSFIDIPSWRSEYVTVGALGTSSEGLQPQGGTKLNREIANSWPISLQPDLLIPQLIQFYSNKIFGHALGCQIPQIHPMIQEIIHLWDQRISKVILVYSFISNHQKNPNTKATRELSFVLENQVCNFTMNWGARRCASHNATNSTETLLFRWNKLCLILFRTAIGSMCEYFTLSIFTSI